MNYSRILAMACMLVGVTPGVSCAQEVVEPQISSEYQRFRLVRIADELRHPWAVAFLSNGSMLITERGEGMVLIQNGEKQEIQGLPDFHAVGQGGMLDVVTHPQHAENGWIYLTYSKRGEGGTVPALLRARLDGTSLVDVEELFESNTYTQPGRHYGSRILFLQEGTLLMTIGDRGATPMRAQDTKDHSGSIIRLNDDGTVPDDNPFIGNEDYAPEIFAYGLRNVQGIALHPHTGEIWATDHGPRGGDELNLIEPGENYGWPIVTLGLDYRTEDEFPDARSRHKEGMVDPVLEFVATLAPSGLTAVSGDRYPNWDGNLLAGGLVSERIMRLVLDEHTVIHAEELLLQKIGRIRDVRQGPDGYIYILNDDPDGGLYRIEPY